MSSNKAEEDQKDPQEQPDPQDHRELAEQDEPEQVETGSAQEESDDLDITLETIEDADPVEVIAALRGELEEQRDLQLRARAEAENVRRRAEADVANSRKFAIETFARELLAVRDSLELASSVKLDEGRDDVVAKMEEGLQLTLKQMDHVFEKFDISEVKAEPGDKPDPELHQAMSLVESDEVESGTIVSVMQKGYLLHDRLLRPAMVLVAK